MTSGNFDFFEAMAASSNLSSVRTCKPGEDLGSIYSFKKNPKARTRKITPVSKKCSPLPRCRQQEYTACWSVQEEGEEAEAKEEEKATCQIRTEVHFTFDEDFTVDRLDSKRADSATSELGLCPRYFGNSHEGRPASFSDYTETALEMRIKHEMERFLSFDKSGRRRTGSGHVSPLLKRAVVSNTLTGRKTTGDSGYHEDLIGEETLFESDEENISCDLISSDDEHSSPSHSESCNGYYGCDKGSTRRRKITPIPRCRGPSRKDVSRARETRGGKACMSLEEEDFEDVENFNSDDDYVDMGISSKQSSKSVTKPEECTTCSISPTQDESSESRLRSFSSDCHGDPGESYEIFKRPEPRRRKRAVTLIPALGELEKCRDVRNPTGNPTPFSCSSGTPDARSRSSLASDEGSSVSAHRTECKDKNPSIQVQVEDGDHVELPSLAREIETDLGMENQSNSLGEFFSTPKGVTRRKLTPADIGHPCLGKMKELRQQMVGLHLEEGDEGTDHKGLSTLDP